METHQDTKRDQSVRFFGARFAEEIEPMISCSERQFGRGCSSVRGTKEVATNAMATEGARDSSRGNFSIMRLPD